MKRYVLKLLVLCCGTAAATTGNHTTLLYVKDHVGSVRTVIDRNGTVVEAKGYYPFGTGMEGKSSQTSATPVPEGFSGQQLDEVEGNVGVKRLSLLNYGARLLDTRLMRWMGRDPLEHESFGINPYQFARNNPLMWIDVGGLECVAPSTGCSYAENLGIMTAVMCDEENTGDCRTVSEELWTCGTDMFGDYLWVKMRESTWSNCPTSGDNLMYAGSDFALIEASVGGKLVYSTEAGWADGYGSYLVADLIGDPFNLANPFNIDYSRMTYAYTNRNGVTTTWGAKYNYPGVRAPGSGDAYFALRPLEGLPWLGPFSNNSLDDRLNLEIAHEQIFFPDGRNVGFFNDNRVRSDNPSLLEGYRTTNTGYNPQTLMEAVNSVVPQNYELLGRNQYNCQNWAEDVRNEYHRINGR